MVISLSSCHPRRRVHRRRNATAVMAGCFDPLPERDVLTSCLNHIGPYAEVEKTEEERQRKKLEKREKERERKRKAREESKAAEKRRTELVVDSGPHASTSYNVASTSSQPQQGSASGSGMGFTRPTIHIPAIQRSVSITPSPPGSPRLVASSPRSTPGRSMSSSTSRTSSKRPHTPDDYEVIEMQPPRPRKRRIAVKKGWKGWVEGSPEPSAKLINLDAVPTLRERRTRSGKNFDAIGVGKDSWV